jgi:hypothetical protein
VNGTPMRCHQNLRSRAKILAASALESVQLTGSPAPNATEPALSPFLSVTPSSSGVIAQLRSEYG